MLVPNPHRFPVEGNDLYPLPADYNSITSAAERKWCRLNALSIQETPEDLVAAWNFFRTYYLAQTPEGFFYKRFFPSPNFHFNLVEDLGRYPYNATAAPRGFSKSTIMAVELPLFLALTRPNFHILLVLSVDRMVNKRIGSQIARQIIENKYILQDFGCMKPSRGNGVWSAHMIQLTNGSHVEGIAVKGRMQGPRPDLIVADDVEFDPVLNQENPELTEHYARLLTEVLLPMLDGFECGLNLIGTLLSQGSFLYHVVTTEDDERFLHWNRRHLDAERTDAGEEGLLWDSKFSRERLERERAVMGDEAYNKNRRNRPGQGGNALFKLHPELNNYEIHGDMGTNPSESGAVLVSWKKAAGGRVERLERPLRDVLPNMTRVLTFDYAQCLTLTSDYVAAPVVGLEYSEDYPDGAWFVLDLYMERALPEVWIDKVLGLSMKWYTQWVGVEDVGAQNILIPNVQRYFAEANTLSWMPSIEPVKYPGVLSKEDRITGLQFRFQHGILKLPLSERNRREGAGARTPFSELIYEVENFNGKPKATQFDDPLDAVAMVQYLFKGEHHVTGSGMPSRGEYNLIDTMKSGDRHIHSESMGMALPTVLGLMPSEITMQMVRDAMKETPRPKERLRDRSSPGPRIIVRRGRGAIVS